MRNQTIGVSLPQKNEVDLNSKFDVFTDKNRLAANHLKNDFEKALKKSSQKDDFKLETKTDKSKKNFKSEFNLESKKSKQSSGTNKKKMTERKDSSISNNMASSENVIEIPDEMNDLALEEIQFKEGIDPNTIRNSLKNENLNNGIISQIQEDENSIHFASDSIQLNPDNDFLKKNEVIHLEQMNQSEFKIENTLSLQDESQVSFDSQSLDQSEIQLETSENSIPIEFRNSMNKELAEQVGYQSLAYEQTLDENLVNQLNKFETEKGIAPEEIKPFELAVFQQLQQLNDERLVESQLQKQNLSSIDSTQFKDQLNSGDVSANSMASLTSPAYSNSSLTSEKEKFNDEKGNNDHHKDQNTDSSIVGLKKDSIQDDSLHLGQQSQQSFKNELNSASYAKTLDSSIQQSSNMEDHLDQNIQEIMSKSHFLAKAGGGEMHIKMSPDGLSEVHLKVLLNDGRVNIEMQTQDRSLKKLLEDSLGELKSGLAHQQLKVDHIRIETVMPTQTDNSAQFQFKERNNHSDHKQRELWNQLQNTISSKGLNSGLKKEYANKTLPETSSLRTYGGTKGSQFNKVA